MLRATINLRPMLNGMKRLAKEIGVNVQDLCEDQMRLACQDAIKKTSPYDGTGGTSRHKTMGQQAVAKDLNLMFAPIETEGMLWQWRNEVDDAGGEIFKTTKRGKKRLRGMKVVQNASIAHIKALHLQNRNAMGRVNYKGDKSQVFDGRYLVPKKDLVKYMKSEQKKVGQLKAGWVPAGEKFSKHHRFIAAAWIKKQAKLMGYGSGRISNRGSGALIATNSVPYAERRIRPSVMVEVIRTREKDMQKWAKKRLDKVAEKWNRNRI